MTDFPRALENLRNLKATMVLVETAWTQARRSMAAATEARSNGGTTLAHSTFAEARDDQDGLTAAMALWRQQVEAVTSFFDEAPQDAFDGATFGQKIEAITTYHDVMTRAAGLKFLATEA